MHQVFIGLGSNLGDRLKSLADALSLIHGFSCCVLKISNIYETEPVGPVQQQRFLNAAAKVETDLDCLQLLSSFKKYEKDLGRQKRERWGPRIIDIDILTFDQIIFQHPKLMIPHPELHKRRFVLVPFQEIAPDQVISGLKKTVQELLEVCTDKSQVVLYMSSSFIWERLKRDLS